ncbi:MAG: dihydrolipoamide acetyltransferase family protein [Gammaproteobacteria bacterium]
MSIFNLPDLGEGLPDAEVCEWHVKEGDTVAVDQPLVSMETAKAVVEVPSPQAGKIARLHGKKGDIIKTGAPLVEFSNGKKDAGTVVGEIKSTGETIKEDFIIGSAQKSSTPKIKATPAVRALAKKLNIDLSTVTSSRSDGMISIEDVNRSHQQVEGYEPLHGVRRSMAIVMAKAHQEVVPVTIFDEVDINHWNKTEDITVRLIQAMIKASQQEPELNALYNGIAMSRQLSEQVNIGLAIDTAEGLFVPVIHEAEKKSAAQLRKTINELKVSVSERNIEQEKLHGATITLSNFGKFAGRYASPIIVPPTVAILAVGKIHQQAVVTKDKIAAHTIMPLSLTFDHRVASGGEACRFLGVIIEALQH